MKLKEKEQIICSADNPIISALADCGGDLCYVCHHTAHPWNFDPFTVDFITTVMVYHVYLELNKTEDPKTFSCKSSQLYIFLYPTRK